MRCFKIICFHSCWNLFLCPTGGYWQERINRGERAMVIDITPRLTRNTVFTTVVGSLLTVKYWFSRPGYTILDPEPRPVNDGYPSFTYRAPLKCLYKNVSAVNLSKNMKITSCLFLRCCCNEKCLAYLGLIGIFWNTIGHILSLWSWQHWTESFLRQSLSFETQNIYHHDIHAFSLELHKNRNLRYSCNPLWTRIWFCFQNFFRIVLVLLLGAYFDILWRHQFFVCLLFYEMLHIYSTCHISTPNHRPIAPSGAGELSTREVDRRPSHSADTGHRG